MQTLDRPEIKKFKAEHIGLMNIKDKDKLIFKIPTLLEAYEKLGTSYTFVSDGKYLCTSGIIKYWEGVGEAWLVLSDDMDTSKKSICSIVKKYLDEMLSTEYKRIQATVKADDDVHMRFIEWCGFRAETILKKYGLEGADYYLYARVS